MATHQTNQSLKGVDHVEEALAGTATLAIIGATLVHAQEGSGRGSDTGGRGGGRPPVAAEDMGALADAGIAALKAGLGLTPDQERNWPPLEQALRALAKARSERMAAQRDTPPPSDDPIERLRRRADAMNRIGPLLKQLADAAQPLYQSLDEGQKRRFVFLAHVLRTSLGQHRTGGDWRDRRGWGGRHDGRASGGREDDRGWYDRRGWRGGEDDRGWYDRRDWRRREDDRGWYTTAADGAGVRMTAIGTTAATGAGARITATGTTAADGTTAVMAADGVAATMIADGVTATGVTATTVVAQRAATGAGVTMTADGVSTMMAAIGVTATTATITATGFNGFFSARRRSVARTRPPALACRAADVVGGVS